MKRSSHAYVINLFKEIAPGYNFIVGMGDNLPFDGRIERVGRVAELIDKYGSPLLRSERFSKS